MIKKRLALEEETFLSYSKRIASYLEEMPAFKNAVGGELEDGADMLRLDIHAERRLGLVDDYAVGIAFLHIGLELRVGGIVAAAHRTLGYGVAATGEEQNSQNDAHDDVDPVHVEPGHLWLVVLFVGVVVHCCYCLSIE